MRRTFPTLGAILSAALALPLGAQPVGSEFRVNAYTTSNQRLASVAVNGAGDFVVVWVSNGEVDPGYGIFAQRYASSGATVGPEFRVNTSEPQGFVYPSVAMRDSGGFVVVWQAGLDGSSYGVFGQRFTSAGSPSGAEFRVNGYTTFSQSFARVAMNGAGDFVVVWTGQSVTPGDVANVFGQRYTSAGSPSGSEFRVNTLTTDTQYLPSVALDGSGNFVVVWQSFGPDGSGYGVFGQRYASSGSPLGGEFQINTFTTFFQRASRVAMSGSGDFVVTWESQGEDGSGFGVFGQRFASSGAPAGQEFRANTTTALDQRPASVAMDPIGNFIVVWQGDGQDGSAHGIFAQQYTSAGVPLGTEFRVNSYTSSEQSYPSVALDGSGRSVVAWESDGQDGAARGIIARRACLPLLSVSIGVVGATSVCAAGTGGAASVTDAGGGANAHQWKWRPLGGMSFTAITGATGATYQIRGSDFGAGAAGTYELVCETTPQCGSASTSNAVVVTVCSQAVGSEFRVNGYTTGGQYLPSVAIDGAGNFVVAWQAVGLDGAGEGIFGKRFTSSGSVLGSDFRINTYTTSNQRLASVAVNSAGDFVVAWASRDQVDPGYGVFAQRYASSGAPVGPEFRVNTSVPQGFVYPGIGIRDSGDFVVIWQAGQDGSGYGVFGQRFTSAGSPAGVEFRVNGYTSLSQAFASVAMNGSGDFVVVWGAQSFTPGDVTNIFGQRFTSAGSPAGTEFRVNTYTTNTQYVPSVALDGSGNFVVAWQSFDQDGFGYGIFGQRYSSSGAPLGAEMPINSHGTSAQRAPRVAMNVAGDFVVAWESLAQDGSGYGIFGQRFGSSGARAGSEFQINSVTALDQRAASVAIDGLGNFVVAWQSAGQDGSVSGIFAQRFCPPLTSVTIGVVGSTTVCATGTGGTTTVTDVGGGGRTHQWMWRPTAGMTLVPIAGAVGTAYQIQGADFGGGAAGSYDLVCATFPDCPAGTTTLSNAVTVTVTADGTPPMVAAPTAAVVTQTLCQ